MELAHKLASTRRGTLALAVLAAVIAGALVLVYVNRYRNSVKAQSAPVTVLVASTAIPKGTPGRIVAERSLYTVTTVRESQLRNGAFSDPASLAGTAAATDIYAGEQLTSGEFSASATALPATITGDQRIMSLPIDASHALIGELQAGNHVDVYVGFNVTAIDSTGTLASGVTRPVLRLIVQDVPVVSVVAAKSSGIGGNSGPEVNLKVSDQDAAKLAFASDNGKIWLVLRPASGATPASPNIVSAETLLLGAKPVAVLHSLGGQR